MLYQDKPSDFNPRFEIAHCFCEHGGELLLLERQDAKSQGGKWGPPAGKLNPGENPKVAAIREVYEETAISLPQESPTHLATLYVRYPEHDFTFHVFKTVFGSRPPVSINTYEHKAYQWCTPQDAVAMNLVLDEREVVKQFYNLP